MNALRHKQDAMVLSNPDRKTASGRKQANHLWYVQNRLAKAEYNATYYANKRYRINCAKTVKRANSTTQSLKDSIIRKWNIKWDPDTQKHLHIS